VHNFESDFTTAVGDENMVDLSRHLSSQQKSMIIGFRIKYGSSAIETRGLRDPGTASDRQMEMEQYLMECIKYHQRLIECVMCKIIIFIFYYYCLF
jgi:hypothetical protein